jgi:hypothetical protein
MDALNSLKGVIRLKLLSNEEKKIILEVEEKGEDKIAWGMCKSINEGMREALDREHTIGMIIDSSKFQYPYHPHMVIKYKDKIIGEEVTEEKASDLKSEKTNVFLAENFVVYFKRIPKEPEARREIRLYYLARPFEIPTKPTITRNCVLGVPSIEGDGKLKELLAVDMKAVEIGTCLVGYDSSRES